MTHRGRLRSTRLIAVLVFFGVLATSSWTADQGAGDGQGPINYYALKKMPTVSETPAIWSIRSTERVYDTGITCGVLHDMKMVSPDRLLVSFITEPLIMVDPIRGKLLWALAEKNQRTSAAIILHATLELVLFQPVNAVSVELVAVEGQTGKEIWAQKFKPAPSNVRFLPAASAGVIIAVECDKGTATLSALQMASGSAVWKFQAQARDGKAVSYPCPIMSSAGIWHFYDGVQYVDAATGKVRWKRNEIQPGPNTPPPRLEDGVLHLVDREHRLVLLDATTGEQRGSVNLDKEFVATNLYPYGPRVYVRGRKPAANGEAQYLLTATEPAKGTLWSFSSDVPTVSNLIEEKNRLFVSAVDRLFCLDRGTGERCFEAPTAKTGRSYPVEIRHLGKLVVYMGELIIAGYDAETGMEVYRQGIDPVGVQAHLNALDTQIGFQEKIIRKASRSSWFLGGMGDILSRQAQNSQNRANEYRAEASRARSKPSPDYGKAEILDAQADIASISARSAAEQAFFFSMQDLMASMWEVVSTEARGRMNQLSWISGCIYKAYPEARNWEYVHRPHRVGEKVGIMVIHLPTGKSAWTALSPACGNGGIFNIVDFEKELVYHYGLRMLPPNLQPEPKGTVADKYYAYYLAASKAEIPK